MADMKLEGVYKSYGDVEVLHGVDIDITDGEFVVFVGPSGCGKSTLLRMIAGLEDISGGDISISGERVNDKPPADRGIAMVFQSYALYPHMSVRKNMAFGLSIAKLGKAEIKTRVDAAAEKLQLTELLHRRPAQLSGGQRQRVAIGRAIVREPQVFLFDEPLSNLDAALRVNTRLEIAKLHQDLQNTVIYVTHDQVEAMTLADKIVVMNGGNVEQIGSPMDLYHRPANLFVAGFIGSPKMNFLPGTVVSVDGSSIAVQVAGSLSGTVTFDRPGNSCSSGDSITLGVRPEHLTAAGNELSGAVEVVERLGDVSYIYLNLADGERLVIAESGTTEVAPGEKIGCNLDPASLHLFDADGKVVN
ncbi:MAG: sn-glycerol-3-phosphate ABC transporter ATP-binding protein UgpC [Alphaproteobacteria bacterium]|jgi:ABC-type sugar transport system ATPase subunit|nr:sn-glycerol-3-phosphate ABC transporter ATP-binding protein UgpC [Alphaproteobacteria bacterium]MBT4083717.1 sn-glycerol-3-phosphate ABC transporter ATP-binding protein UgpC [Alphaproteobacteria bacterium]MBT4545239.1 sn-glycerol-3-phosphate ABC transporter ATP-binding protein UgpC [Alphaproteobacteria bacterium]MBT5917198.1 sn-glycerol-3-phosphate ABC transporter ATP-binding protein UgpC [Alphaproteobacteria bacterium]MBT6386201.1 sn-glycerol-3-phosphate ABC transporter ATP-binding protein 